MTLWKAPKIWSGGECWIIGGGPSLTEQFDIPEDLVAKVHTGECQSNAYSEYLAPIHDKHLIAINNAYQLGDWIDVVFFGDSHWYMVHRSRLAAFPGLKVTVAPRFANKPIKKCEGIKYMSKDKRHRWGISRDEGKISWNGNSGAAAISLAVHFGVKRIVLLGFDMNKGSNGQAAHWHRGHGSAKNPPFKRHLMGWPKIAEDAMACGVEILNANPTSSIKAFPKLTVESLL